MAELTEESLLELVESAIADRTCLSNDTADYIAASALESLARVIRYRIAMLGTTDLERSSNGR